MALLRNLTRSTLGRFSMSLLSAGLLAAAVMLLAVACGGKESEAPAAPVSGPSGGQGGGESSAVKVYSSPT